MELSAAIIPLHSKFVLKKFQRFCLEVLDKFVGGLKVQTSFSVQLRLKLKNKKTILIGFDTTEINLVHFSG